MKSVRTKKLGHIQRDAHVCQGHLDDSSVVHWMGALESGASLGGEEIVN